MPLAAIAAAADCGFAFLPAERPFGPIRRSGASGLGLPFCFFFAFFFVAAARPNAMA